MPASDPFQIVGVKGLMAGPVNVVLALSTLAPAMLIRLFGYGLSLALLILQESPNLFFVLGFAAMALGLWLHLSEQHNHPHYPDIHHHQPH